MSLRIAIAIEWFNPGGGGNERSTAQMAEELTRRGHQVTILAGSAPRELADLPYRVEARSDRPKAFAHTLRYYQWAERQLAEGDHDVSLSVTMTVAADVLQPRGGTIRETLRRNVALRHSPASRMVKRVLLALTPKQLMLLAMERRTLTHPRVKRVVALSEYVAWQLREHYSVDGEKVTVIPNAAAVPDVDAARRQQWRREVRQAFSIPDDAAVYVFSARNPRLKGFGTLIDAVDRLTRQGHQPVVLLTGEMGYSAHDVIQRRGLRDRFRFVGMTGQMPALYAASDVTVLPTFYDPSSKVVIESLMLGTPAITTRYNGAAAFVTPDDGPPRGRVIDDPADADALAAAMVELVDPATHAACVAATAGLHEPLSMKRHVDQLEQVLHDAARAGRA